MAEACGIDSNEYKIYMQGVNANKAMHDFEKANPKTLSDFNKYSELEKKNPELAYEYEDSLDIEDYERLSKYRNL